MVLLIQRLSVETWIIIHLPFPRAIQIASQQHQNIYPLLQHSPQDDVSEL